MGATRDIVSRAMKDQTFRQNLLKDAKTTIQKELGIEFPEGVTIQVHENAPNVVHLVLPSPLDMSTQRPLTKEQLQQVAGGVYTAPTMSGVTFGGYTGCCATHIRCTA